jgi:hypothetical protein
MPPTKSSRRGKGRSTGDEPTGSDDDSDVSSVGSSAVAAEEEEPGTGGKKSKAGGKSDKKKKRPAAKKKKKHKRQRTSRDDDDDQEEVEGEVSLDWTDMQKEIMDSVARVPPGKPSLWPGILRRHDAKKGQWVVPSKAEQGLAVLNNVIAYNNEGFVPGEFTLSDIQGEVVCKVAKGNKRDEYAPKWEVILQGYYDYVSRCSNMFKFVIRFSEDINMKERKVKYWSEILQDVSSETLYFEKSKSSFRKDLNNCVPISHLQYTLLMKP